MFILKLALIIIIYSVFLIFEILLQIYNTNTILNIIDEDESGEYEFEDTWEEDCWWLLLTYSYWEIDPLTYSYYMSRINF